MEPFRSHGDSRKQLVADSEVIGERMRTLKVGIRIRKRNRAEILRHIGEIDFATRCDEIHAAKLALRYVILV